MKKLFYLCKNSFFYSCILSDKFFSFTDFVGIFSSKLLPIIMLFTQVVFVSMAASLMLTSDVLGDRTDTLIALVGDLANKVNYLKLITKKSEALLKMVFYALLKNFENIFCVFLCLFAEPAWLVLFFLFCPHFPPKKSLKWNIGIQK